MDFINSNNNNFCSLKDIATGMKRQATDWEEKIANRTSNKRLVSSIHKEPSKLNKTNNPIFKNKGFEEIFH